MYFLGALFEMRFAGSFFGVNELLMFVEFGVVSHSVAEVGKDIGYAN